jgi:hypothetical protein
MPQKVKVRYVKFTPKEMAIDAGDVDASELPVIARGRQEWLKFLSVKRGYVRLTPDVLEFFKNDEAVNNALRKLIEAMPTELRKRKTA